MVFGRHKEGIELMISDIDAEVRYTRKYIGKERLSAEVMEAMRHVPRSEFVPDDMRCVAYNNGPLPIGHGQTISQPYIVALMTDLLLPKKTDIVLEVGTGSGYQAAVLSLLVKEVYSTEIIDALATDARERVQRLNYKNVEVRQCNGYFGWKEHAPYDGIIVTAAANEIPQPLFEQLKPGARLVIPIGEPYMYQELMVVEKDEAEQLTETRILGVSFVPLTGSHIKPPNM
jgi:protein-L-isoaspartate(D-aspartate) O-methyltransferase